MIPIFLIVLTGIATLVVLAGFVIIAPQIMGPFFELLGDSGIGGATANGAIDVSTGLLFVAVSGMSVIVAIALYLKFGGRRRSPRRRRV